MEGYTFLGSNNKDFNERFTRSEFKMVPKEKMSKSQLEEYEKYCQQGENYRMRHYSEKNYNKEISLKLIHCMICDKDFIDMSFMYCIKCPYHVPELFKSEKNIQSLLEDD